MLRRYRVEVLVRLPAVGLVRVGRGLVQGADEAVALAGRGAVDYRARLGRH